MVVRAFFAPKGVDTHADKGERAALSDNNVMGASVAANLESGSDLSKRARLSGAELIEPAMCPGDGFQQRQIDGRC